MRYSLLLAALLVAIATPVLAAVPSPANSTLPNCVVSAPNGGVTISVVVRDLAFNPILTSMVVLDYADCPGFVPCPAAAGDGYVVDLPTKTVRSFTGAGGVVNFALRAGGGCFNSGIRIYADGVLLGQRRAASADQNGDHTVDGVDIAAVTAKIGTSDLSGDLDCDGAVTGADQVMVASFVGANCLDPTPARHSTWGRLKTTYR